MFVSNDVFFDLTRVVMLFGRHTLAQSPTREAARSRVRVHSSPVFGVQPAQKPANHIEPIAKDHLSQRLHIWLAIVTRSRGSNLLEPRNRINKYTNCVSDSYAFRSSAELKELGGIPLHASWTDGVFRRDRMTLHDAKPNALTVARPNAMPASSLRNRGLNTITHLSGAE